MSRLDYLALQPTSSVSGAPAAVHAIGQCTRRTPRSVVTMGRIAKRQSRA